MSDKLPTRERILRKTSELLEKQGYHATGLKQIVSESDSPMGSLYHYFPDGKEELVMEAVEISGRTIQHNIEDVFSRYDDPIEAITAFIDLFITNMNLSHCTGGDPLTSVVLETASSSERLREACFSAYETWRMLFEEKLRQGNISQKTAYQLSMLIIASLEGAIVLCRVHQNTEPVAQVRDSIIQLIQHAQ